MKTKPRSDAFILLILTVAGIAVMFIILWKQQSNVSRFRLDYGRLKEQNEGLKHDLTHARAEAIRLSAVPASAQTMAAKDVQDHSQDNSTLQLTALQPTKIQPKVYPAGLTPEQEPNRLALVGAEVQAIPGGLATTMRFTPRKTGPLGLVALAIRLPKNVDVRILDLAPVGSTTYSDDNKTMSGDGKFAFFQGTPGEATNMQFALSVSGPATVNVSGTHGIGAFQLEIQSAGATVLGK